MARRKELQIWTVRNTSGQFIGRYRTYSAEQAISRVIEEQMATAATFRRSQPLTVRRDDFTAKIEA